MTTQPQRLEARENRIPQDCAVPAEGSGLSWILHPAAKQPLRTAVLLLGIAVILVLVYFMMGNPFWVVFAALILLVSLRQFFVPTTFWMDETSVGWRFLMVRHKRPWTHFKSFFVDRNGVLLSPFPGPSRLENFRGLYLIGANREPAAMEFIRRKLARPEPS